MYKFKFADIGEGLHEGKVAEIYVKLGDTVKEGDSLFSVETDKITSDIPSPTGGVINKILFELGGTVHVGEEIFWIDDGSGPASDSPEPAAAEAKPAAEEHKSSAGDLFGSRRRKPGGSAAAAAPSPAPAPVAAPAPAAVAAPSVAGKVAGKAYTGAVEAEYDVIVIGAGPGGYLAAEEAGKYGLKTLIIEKQYWGGVCLNVGCIPTKALLHATEELYNLEHSHEHNGIVADFKALKIDRQKTWINIQKNKKSVVDKIVGGVKFLMKAAKATSIEGEAKFVGSHELEVNGKVYRGKNIIIATGSLDRKLNLPGFEQAYKDEVVLSSDKLINLDSHLPETLGIIGAGVIGVEFAEVFAMAGTKVTIIQNTDAILANAPLAKEIKTELTNHLKKYGVEFKFNASTTKIEKNQLFFEVGGKEESMKFDKILAAVGRIPTPLNAGEVGIEIGQRNEIIVDDKLMTNVENVYAIGDVTGKNMLAHVAYRHAIRVVESIVGEEEVYPKQEIPGCIYTKPEIAFVGLTEQQAKEAGYDVVTSKYSFSTLGKALASSEGNGFVQLVVDKKYGRILGCHIIGKNSTDYIAEIVLAMDNEISVFEIAATIHPHPTYGEIVWEAARALSLKLNIEKHKK
ncbi:DIHYDROLIPOAMIDE DEHYDROGENASE (E3 COMPONENT OF PYRUVATE COMPLEX) [Mycoplasmopsis pulmonis]|uniref:Dihydrolipoyl dehydrogenase n=1 Tax=Mycoplasmopsis pulmonis (strain UAB CTIP) TaxID=272635 RepID=Q98PG2_MYCPU|nr:dihydrolipoyl dehydrogenase [Mycoplasmopsis pulmonis]MDZ7293395.1 dihydrolipoyl dehydrogenase [Mycoplasmopsis pulmonis]CAC13934.1 DIHYDROLIPOAMIDE DEHYDROGENASE (E3 COMPONENT OF PYRUVATE COMPLEX) [Mycoplasmopsis pulmonis]